VYCNTTTILGSIDSVPSFEGAAPSNKEGKKEGKKKRGYYCTTVVVLLQCHNNVRDSTCTIIRLNAVRDI
jgi:hypothetical protein